ncbi:MAG: methyltransferase [Stackebrandtia sp.]
MPDHEHDRLAAGLSTGTSIPSVVRGAAANTNATLADLRSMLADARFTGDQVADILDAADIRQVIANPAIHAFLLDPAQPRLATTPSGMLVQLFILNRILPAGLAERALGSDLHTELLHSGLLVHDAGSCHATVSITPFEGRLFLSDRIFTSAGQHQVTKSDAINLCMPPHASSLLTLDGVSQPGSRLLDVGCGSGFIGLVAQAGDGRLSGIDLNRRCIDFAYANAAINDVPADFDTADYRSHAPTDDRKYTDIIFNAPGLPDTSEGEQELGREAPEALLTHMARAMVQLLGAGGKAHVNVLIEIPEGFSAAVDVVDSWLSGSEVADFSVHEHRAPEFAVTRDQIARGRLSGRTLLVSSPSEAGPVVDGLRRRGIAEVVPAVVTLTR